MLRIIAGQRRGHRIDTPTGRDVRPTSDRVRESLFNILRDDVDGRTVVDLFAGTGALGLEALSRGATRAIFVERDRESAALIRRNLAALRYDDRGTVVVADAYRWAATFRAIDAEPLLVFVDPPYREYDGRHADRPRRLVVDLLAALPAGSTLVIESGADLGPDVLPDPDAWDRRRYGSTHVAIRTLGPPAPTEDSEAPGSTATEPAPGP